MERRNFLNTFLALPAAFISNGTISALSGNIDEQPKSTFFNESFVSVSNQNPFYFQLSNGEPFIVNGPCLSGAKDMESMELFLQKIAANGGNFARVWLCNRLFEVELQFGKYNEQQAKKIDQLLKLATKYNLKLKLCLDNTRQIIPDESAWFNRPQYHIDNGGPFNNIDEYINSDEGRQAYLNRIIFFSKRYGNHPAIFGWELWNEMNGIMCEGLENWNEYMLPKVHKLFPKNLVLQSLGSFDSENRRPAYRFINQMLLNDVAQIHRYIDSHSSLDICTAPMDILASDAIDELRSYHIKKPMLLAEVGAVLPDHTGPSHLYPVDKDGSVLHDSIFAPFFSGAAGGGNNWHWDAYIDKNNLWYHYNRFHQIISGINPLKEAFVPVKLYHEKLRIYILVGNNTILAWCRDIENDWSTEFIENKIPIELSNIKINFSSLVSSKSVAKVELYDPWKNLWINTATNNLVSLPSFKRSIVVKIYKQ